MSPPRVERAWPHRSPKGHRSGAGSGPGLMASLRALGRASTSLKSRTINGLVTLAGGVSARGRPPGTRRPPQCP